MNMNKITFPLKRRMKRPEVVNLQDALQLLPDRRLLLAGDDAARTELSAALPRERGQQTYDAVTTRLVARFQQERRLEASGDVDEPTAGAFNGLLEELGAFGDTGTSRVAGRVASRVSAAVGGEKAAS
jgi:peptidoglycan hydrolase-like protein with peptidoglycan-binding domain